MKRNISPCRQLLGTPKEFLEERNHTLTQFSKLPPGFVPDRIIVRVKASYQGSYLIVVHCKPKAGEQLFNIENDALFRRNLAAFCNSSTYVILGAAEARGG
jgi:hypothetical protein